MNRSKKTVTLIVLSLVFLANPNVNMIDILPDFIAYFLLYSVISHSSSIVPYFEEAKQAFKKLGIVTLVRIPCMFIVFTNMHTGRDIVPLFTLVFAVTEAVLLFGAITNTANGLFYLGQRSDADALISGCRVFGIKMSSDGFKIFTLVFFFTKCALNALPEFCLLTTYNAKLKHILTVAYPILLVVSILTVMAIGLAWLFASLGYIKRVRSTCNIREQIAELAGEEKLALIATKMRTNRMTCALTLLAIGSLFSFDISFTNTNGVNILPRFIFVILYLICAFKLYSGTKIKAVLSVLAVVYTVVSLFNHYQTIVFSDNYEMLDLLDRVAAQEAYAPIRILSAAELIVFVPFAVLMAVGFVKFLHEHTGLSPSSKDYGKVEAVYHRNESFKGCLLFVLGMLINLGKCTNAFLDAEIELVYTDGGTIVTSVAPWFDFLLIALSVILVGFSFYYLSSVKAEVRFKYDIEERETRKGVFE